MPPRQKPLQTIIVQQLSAAALFVSPMLSVTGRRSGESGTFGAVGPVPNSMFMVFAFYNAQTEGAAGHKHTEISSCALSAANWCLWCHPSGGQSNASKICPMGCETDIHEILFTNRFTLFSSQIFPQKGKCALGRKVGLCSG